MFSDPGGKRSVTGRDAVVLLIGLILGLLLGGLLPSGDALAQPGGSYSKTCKNCTDDGSTLRCECSYKNKFSPTYDNYPGCSDDIANCDGNLTCGRCP
jgi:hypothetical protein